MTSRWRFAPRWPNCSRRKAAATGLLAASLLQVSAAVGQVGERLVVVAGKHERDVEARVAAELASRGFEVVLVGAGDARWNAVDLRLLARERAAIAAIRLSMDEQVLSAFLADPASDRTLLQQVPLVQSAGRSPEEGPVVALRMVELLRASLLERGLSVSPPPANAHSGDERATATALPEVTRRAREAVFSVGVGGSIHHAGGGVPPWMAPQLGAFLSVISHGEAFVTLSIPAFAATRREPEGDLSLHVWKAAAGIHAVLAERHWLRPYAGINVSAMYLRATGEAHDGFVGSTEGTWMAAAEGEMGLLFVLGKGMAVRLSAGAALPWPRPHISIGNRQVATWEQPLLNGTLGVQTALF